jgi:hypothetical protein
MMIDDNKDGSNLTDIGKRKGWKGKGNNNIGNNKNGKCSFVCMCVLLFSFFFIPLFPWSLCSTSKRERQEGYGG